MGHTLGADERGNLTNSRAGLGTYFRRACTGCLPDGWKEEDDLANFAVGEYSRMSKRFVRNLKGEDGNLI